MRILFLSHRIPFPPDKGDKIRSFHVLRYLTRRHEVHLACFLDNPRDERALNQWQGMVSRVFVHRLPIRLQRIKMIGSVFTGAPLSVQYFQRKEMAATLQTLNKQYQYDALFVYSSNMAGYARHLDIPLKIIDFCDVDSHKFRQYAAIKLPPISWVYRLEGERLSRFEKKAVQHFDHVIFINTQERGLFAADDGAQKIHVMPNGAELPPPPINRNTGAVSPKRPYLLFTGALNYLPNVDAARWLATAIFPRIRSVIPEMRCYLVGGHPVRKIRALHSPAAGVYVTGYVEDIVSYIRSASAFVAPMRIARGMQTKLLEAMVCGIPVVTSPAAARGIGAWPGREVLTGETPSDYAKQVLTLLLNPRFCKALCTRARKFLERKFDWEKNLSVLDAILMDDTPTQPPVALQHGAGHTAFRA